MAVDPELVDDITATITDLYREVETALVETVAARLRQDLPLPSPFQEGKLQAVQQLNRAAQVILAGLQAARSDAVRQAAAQAYTHGAGSALADLPEQWFPKSGIGQAARKALDTVPNAATIQNIAQALHADLGRLDANILRAPLDAYRAVQAGTAARIASGAYTRREASQAAWQALMDKGITGFTDKAGRRWRLSSYVEMMARTNIARAAVKGQVDRLLELGEDLVYVSSAPRRCPRCAPWEGKILSIGGGRAGRVRREHSIRDGEMVDVVVEGTLDEARGAGLFHPSCRHSVSLYSPGVTKLPTVRPDPDGYKASQKQRYLERKIRAAKEQQVGALTPEAKKDADAKVRAAQAQLRDHLAAHPDLKRLRYRESIGAGNIPKAGGAHGGPVTPLQPPVQPTLDGGPGAKLPVPRTPEVPARPVSQVPGQLSLDDAREQARQAAEAKAKAQAEKAARAAAAAKKAQEEAAVRARVEAEAAKARAAAAKAAAEAKARAEAEAAAAAKARAEAQARAEAEAKARAEKAAAEARARAEAKARAEAEARAAADRARAEKAAAAKAAAEAKARAEAEARAAAAKARAEREAAAKKAAEARARAEAEKRAAEAKKAAEAKARAEREAAEKARRKAELARKQAERAAERAAHAAAPKPKAAPTPTPKPKPKPAGVEAGDFTGLRQVGGQSGSNPGGLFEDDKGRRWYVKTQKSQQHAANEIAAARLYKAAGVDTPDIRHGRGAPGLPDGPQTASRVVKGRTGTAEQLRGPAREGFAVDAWLANWDVAGLTFDNMLLTPGGGVARIDTGGALLFRAQGAPKGNLFGNKVNEWTSLRDRELAPQASALFSGMTPAELERALKKVQQVKPEAVRRIVAEAGLPSSVADTLIARQKDLLSHLPGVQAAPKAKTVAARQPAAGMREAVRHLDTGEAIDWAKQNMPLPSGLTKEEKQGIRNYTGSQYTRINTYLRYHDQAFLEKHLPKRDVAAIKKTIERADAALAKARTPTSLIVHRGVGAPFAEALGASVGDAASMQALVGKTFTERGYVSTSVGAGAAYPGEVYMMIRIPKDYQAMNVMTLSQFGKMEREVLIRRDANFVVHAAYERAGRWHLEVEIVPDGWKPPAGWVPDPYGDAERGYTKDGSPKI